MLYVPVVSSTGKPLMPCHPARARELVRKGRAVRRFDRGMFYIRLLDRADGDVQPVACGIDPGSKKEGFTVKSEAHTYLNLQADAVTWVEDAIETRRNMRRNRRYRKTPYRAPRFNRSRGTLAPSTKASWRLPRSSRKHEQAVFGCVVHRAQCQVAARAGQNADDARQNMV